MTTIRDCLGRVREPAHVWPDGSYACPFCGYATRPPGCTNPACFARVEPPYPVELARQKLEEAERRQEEERARAERAEWRRRYAEERAAERDARRAELTRQAQERGACFVCLFRAGWEYRPVKMVRHRGVCPGRG